MRILTMAGAMTALLLLAAGGPDRLAGGLSLHATNPMTIQLADAAKKKPKKREKVEYMRSAS